MANVITNPLASTQPQGSTLQNDFTGPSGDKLFSNVHGKWYNAAYQGRVFSANATARTLPVVANNLVSVFAVYNPASSGVNLELISFDCGVVLATTVVNTVGLYYSTGSLAAASTFTTLATALSGSIGANVVNKGLYYSALTHSGTPARHSILGFFGAVTTTAANAWRVNFDGAVIVPPGTVISIANSTAAATTSSFDLQLTWAEIPV